VSKFPKEVDVVYFKVLIWHLNRKWKNKTLN